MNAITVWQHTLRKMISMSPEDIEALRIGTLLRAQVAGLCITSLGGCGKPVDGLKTTKLNPSWLLVTGKQQGTEVILASLLKSFTTTQITSKPLLDDVVQGRRLVKTKNIDF